jgi:ubiquinone/menaquinone biosynthesis C-methylase UbiE
MNIKEAFFPRGKVAGVYPTLTARSEEAYVDFIEDARNILMHAQQRPIAVYSQQLLESAGIGDDPGPESTRAAMNLLMQDPALKTYYRIKRSLQEAFWTCLSRSFNRRREALSDAFATADISGPGTLQYDENWQDSVPDYASREIHIQPGGYAKEELAGLFYDYGLKVFMGGAADHDQLAKHVAKAVAVPDNNSVERILDLGVSAGATTIALKEAYPEAEVWGIDISAPMVRYAHVRAMEAGADIHLRQMAAEELEFPDNHFDAVLAMLLFHELPVPVANEVISEVFRVLRPGGKFTVLDFSGERSRGVYSMFFAEMDAADNGEPYLPDYVRSNIEDQLVKAGFRLEYYEPKAALTRGRIAVKPMD